MNKNQLKNPLFLASWPVLGIINNNNNCCCCCCCCCCCEVVTFHKTWWRELPYQRPGGAQFRKGFFGGDPPWEPWPFAAVAEASWWAWKWWRCFYLARLIFSYLNGWKLDGSQFPDSYLGGGFKEFLTFISSFGEDSQFDSYFSDGLKPPTSSGFRDFCQGWNIIIVYNGIYGWKRWTNLDWWNDCVASGLLVTGLAGWENSGTKRHWWCLSYNFPIIFFVGFNFPS